MIDQKDLNGPHALECLKGLFDGIPPRKRSLLFHEMCAVEGTLNRALKMLEGVRRYFLETPELGGEESPFVKKIDEILPRKKDEK
jgi:hypothetical protein